MEHWVNVSDDSRASTCWNLSQKQLESWHYQKGPRWLFSTKIILKYVLLGGASRRAAGNTCADEAAKRGYSKRRCDMKHVSLFSAGRLGC